MSECINSVLGVFNLLPLLKNHSYAARTEISVARVEKKVVTGNAPFQGLAFGFIHRVLLFLADWRTISCYFTVPTQSFFCGSCSERTTGVSPQFCDGNTTQSSAVVCFGERNLRPGICAQLCDQFFASLSGGSVKRPET